MFFFFFSLPSHHEVCSSTCYDKPSGQSFMCFSLIWFSCRLSAVSHFLPLPPSCGHDRVWHDARTNPRSLCDSRLPAQPGPAGWDLSHHADWQAQIWWLSGVRYDAVASALPGQSGEEAPSDQNRGKGNSECLIMQSETVNLDSICIIFLYIKHVCVLQECS